MANIYAVKLLKNGQLIQQRQVHTGLAENSGAIRIKAQADVVYVLSSESSKKAVTKVISKRVGNDLQLVLDDSISGKPQLIIEDYFAPNQNSALATQGSEGELVLFSPDNAAQMQTIAEPNEVVALTAKGADTAWWSSAGVQLALIAGGLYAVSESKSKSTDNNIQQTAQNSINAYATGVAQASTPTEATFKDAGYSGVTASNVGAINSAIQRTRAKDNASIQKVIATYQKLIDKANGNTADTSTNDPTLADYQTLGVVLLNIERSSNNNPLDLLNDIIKSRTLGDINNVTKLDAFASIADKIMLLAKGDVPPSPLTATELNSIGLIDVTDTNTNSNIAAIRSAIGASADDGTGVKTVSQLKDIQSAYLKVLALADASRGNTNDASKIPTINELQILGVTLGKAGNTTDAQQVSALKLLNDVMDGLNNAGVDTVAEISALAASIDKVMDIAKAASSSEAVSLELSVSDLSALGASGVTSENLAQVVESLRLTQSSDGSKINTFKKMQSAIDLGVVMHYAESSPTASVGHVAPTLGQYLSVGLSNVDTGANKAINSSNWEAVNSAVEALQAIDVNSLSKVQDVVNTYSKLLALADGIKANSSDVLNLADYLGLGALTGFDTVTGTTGGTNTAKAASSSAQKAAALNLLNDVINGRSASQVNSIAEINLLSVAVDKVLDQAINPDTSGNTLKASDFSLLGIQNVNETNLAQVVRNLNAVSENQTDGQKIDTLAEIQIEVSLAVLQLYADNPNNALPTPAAALTQLYKDLKLDNPNINWNDALASSVSSVVNFRDKSDITISKLQDLALAYQSVLLESSSAASNPNPTAAQYKTILKLPSQTATIHLYETAADDTTTTSLNSNALALLNDVVRQKNNANQITNISMLETYANSIDKLMNLAAADSTNGSQLTIADLTNLGFNVNSSWTAGNSAINANGFSNKVALLSNSGADVNTWEKVQTLISQSNVF